MPETGITKIFKVEKISYGNKEPIAALATPLGESALALVRISGGGNSCKEGQGALELLAKVFSRPGKLLSSPGNTVIHGWIADQGVKIDEVMISVYRAPRSYTGEDGADISCHGGIAAVKAVMEVLKKAGFREALPGEFSFRAFMNGKLDLTRSESVMELVSAKTNKAREQAVRRLAGVLESEIKSIKADLMEVLAGTEIYLDYSEDEFFARGQNGADDEESGMSDEENTLSDEEAGRLPERHLAEEAAGRLRALSRLWQQERIYTEGALAVLAGRPNAGKSSLFNYLVREDRSIVTDTPGTTRDWIEAQIIMEDIPFRLVDTAGLKEIDTGEAERIGIERSFELLDKADLVLYVIDGAKGITGEDMEFLSRFKYTNGENENSHKPVLVLWNKADLARPPESCGAEYSGQFLAVSARTGEGISDLIHAAAGLLGKAAPGSLQELHGQNAAGPGTLRQKELIDAALNLVEEALDLSSRGEALDIIAPLFRQAVNSLGEITGEVSSADILEVMFSRFCVGK